MKRKYIEKSLIAFIMIIGLTFPSIVYASAYSISDLGLGPLHFDDSGKLVEGWSNAIDWEDTPYNQSSILNLLNTYFAPDYLLGSTWNDAVLFDINDSYQAVGMIVYSSVNYSLLLDGNKISIFGAWSTALGINNSGQIVGDNGNENGGLYLTGTKLLKDICDFIPQSDSIYFSTLEMSIPYADVLIQNNNWENVGPGTDINNSGEILGVGYINSEYHTYLLTPEAAPVPEPSTLLLFGSGLLGFAGYRKKQNNNTLH